MKLFIDSNIFLSFYDFTSEDLIELNKLVSLIKNRKIDLLLLQQVEDETLRRREEIINKSFKEFKKKIKPPLQFPSYCKTYEQYSRMQDMLKELRNSHQEMISDLEQDIEGHRLSADSLLEKLFYLATKIDRTQIIIDCARQRGDICKSGV